MLHHRVFTVAQKGQTDIKFGKTAEQIKKKISVLLSKVFDLTFACVIRGFAGSEWVSSEPLPPPEVLLLWQECQDVCLLGEFRTSSSKKNGTTGASALKTHLSFPHKTRHWRESPSARA